MGVTGAVLYVAAAWSALAFFLAVSLWPRGGVRFGLIYAPLFWLTFFLFRWPAFCAAGPLDPDESQFLAGALTLRHDPIPWRAFDGQTAGPLVYYALLPLGPFGAVNYFGARLIGGLIMCGALWCGYRTLRTVWGESGARLGILPAYCFLALSTHAQFVHYSSEHVPILLLAIALAGIVGAIARAAVPRPAEPGWLAAGIALGAIPFAKLQAMPAAMFLVFAAAAWVATRKTETPRQRARAIFAFAAGVWVVPLIFAVLLTLGGAWEDFGISYLAQNFSYVGHGWRGVRLRPLARFLLLHDWIFAAVFFGSLAATAAIVWAGPPVRAAVRWPLFVLGGVLVVMLPACLGTHHYVHYLLFLVLPSTLLAGALAAEARRAPAAAGRWPLVAFLGLAMLPAVGGRLYGGNPHLAKLGVPRAGPIVAVTDFIRRHSMPADPLAVWGYWEEPHVATQRRQATSNCNAWSQLTPGRYRDYFRRRYLNELRATRPPVFIDAVAPAEGVTVYRDRRQFGHETFPELRDHVAQNYTLLATVEGVRLYLIRDRQDAGLDDRRRPAEKTP